MNRNLSPREFAGIPPMVQGVADLHAQATGTARIQPLGGAHTVFNPDMPINEEDVDERPTITIGDEPDYDDAFVADYGTYDMRPRDERDLSEPDPSLRAFKQRLGSPHPSEGPPSAEWEEEHPFDDTPEDVYRRWRG